MFICCPVCPLSFKGFLALMPQNGPVIYESNSLTRNSNVVSTWQNEQWAWLFWPFDLVKRWLVSGRLCFERWRPAPSARTLYVTVGQNKTAVKHPLQSSAPAWVELGAKGHRGPDANVRYFPSVQSAQPAATHIWYGERRHQDEEAVNMLAYEWVRDKLINLCLCG